MSLAKSLVRGSFLRVSNTFLSMAVSFIMMPIFIQELGDRWYGVWAIVSGLIGVYFIFDLGVTSAVSRYISKYVGRDEPEKVNTIINTALAIFLSIGLVVILITITVSSFSGSFAADPAEVEVIRILILLTGISVALEFPFNAFAGIPEAHARYDLLTYIRMATLLLGAFANYFLVTNGFGVIAIAIVAFVTSRISNIGYIVLARYLFPKLRLSPSLVSREHFRDLFDFSKWSFAVEMTANLPYRFNAMVIGYFLSASWVTHFVVGQRLVEYSNKILYQATNMMTPIFTQYHAKGDIANMHEKLLFIVRLNSILGVLTIGGLITFAELFIKRWIGDSYPESYEVVCIRIFGLIGAFIFAAANNVLYAINKHSVIAKVTLFDGLISFIGAIVLVQYMGIVGVALAATVPALIGRAIVIPYLTAKQIKMPPGQLFGACLPLIILGGVIVTLEYWAIQFIDIQAKYYQITGYALAFTIIYGAIMFFVGLKKEERHIIFRALPLVPNSST